MLILGGQEFSLILININAYTFYVGGTQTHWVNLPKMLNLEVMVSYSFSDAVFF